MVQIYPSDVLHVRVSVRRQVGGAATCKMSTEGADCNSAGLSVRMAHNALFIHMRPITMQQVVHQHRTLGEI